MPMIAQLKTPCEVLFSMLKSECGMAFYDTARVVLSSRPAYDGRSAVQRASEKTWLLRYVVHAEPGCVSPELFARPEASAPRLVSRMKGKRSYGRRSLENDDILRLATGEYGQAMARSLSAYGSNAPLLANALARVAADEVTPEGQRAEQAVALLVMAAAYNDGAAAAAELARFNETLNTPSALTPPPRLIPPAIASSSEDAGRPEPIGLVRLRDDILSGEAFWLDPDGPGALVSALLAHDPEEGALVVNNVEADVSTMHARIRFHPGVGWAVTGLGSRNGTVVKRPTRHETVVVEPPRDDAQAARPMVAEDAADGAGGIADDGEGRALPQRTEPMPIYPGDTIVFGGATAFYVLIRPSLEGLLD